MQAKCASEPTGSVATFPEASVLAAEMCLAQALAGGRLCTCTGPAEICARPEIT